MKNKDEVIEILNKLNFTGEDFYHDHDCTELESTIGKINVVETFGGEGMGDECYVIIHLVDHNLF